MPSRPFANLENPRGYLASHAVAPRPMFVLPPLLIREIPRDSQIAPRGETLPVALTLISVCVCGVSDYAAFHSAYSPACAIQLAVSGVQQLDALSELRQLLITEGPIPVLTFGPGFFGQIGGGAPVLYGSRGRSGGRAGRAVRRCKRGAGCRLSGELTTSSRLASVAANSNFTMEALPLLAAQWSGVHLYCRDGRRTGDETQ